MEIFTGKEIVMGNRDRGNDPGKKKRRKKKPNKKNLEKKSTFVGSKRKRKK